MQKRLSRYTKLVARISTFVKTFLTNPWVGFGFNGLVLLYTGVMIIQGMPASKLFLTLFILAPFLYSFLIQILALFPNKKAKYADIIVYGCAIYLIFVTIFSLVIKLRE
jgi:hypothetical protein